MKKLGSFLVVLLVSLLLFNVEEADAAMQNLLINGSGEDGMTGWVDESVLNGEKPLWKPSISTTSHEPIDGETFFWPSLRGCKYARMYQDVDVSNIKSGTWMTLGAWLANYNQKPHDQAVIRLEFLDSKGNVLSSDESMQRNPEWQYHEINLKVPSKTVIARISCIANRFVGSDNDAYFDDIQFGKSDGSVKLVVITGDKDKGQPGDTVQLKASDGTYKKASDYEWSSSYDEIATVDEKGLVTFNPKCNESLIGQEVWIYAKNKKTGVIGKYYMNSELKNNSGSDDSDKQKSTAPEAVKNLSIVEIKLKWDKVINADGYYVYSVDINGKYKKVKTIKKASTVSCTISGLKTGEKYTYVVKSYKKVDGKVKTSKDSKKITISL